MAPADFLLLILAVIGHFGACTAVFNRFTARNFPKRVLQLGELSIILFTLAVPLWVAFTYRPISEETGDRLSSAVIARTYVMASAAFAIFWAVLQVRERFFSGRIPVLTQGETVHIVRRNAEPLVEGWATRAFAAIPGNQLLQLEVNEKLVELPGLDPALQGLRIVHFSDLHFTGGLTQDFYRQVVQQVNALEGDFIALTGDIVDTPQYVEWIEPILGGLHAPAGVFFVLGNHDQKSGDAEGIRQRLERVGLISLGGRCTTVSLRNRQLLLAGNERPWFTSLPTFEHDDVALRVALLHTPDEIGWARRAQFQLVLAGHTHGGQVCLPGVGPIISPSRFGTRYAGGVFLEPPVIMHVTRGISGRYPLRFGCQPEITCLVLACAPKN